MHFCWWGVFDDMCRTGQWSCWSSSEVNHTMRCVKKIFSFSFPVTWLWPLDVKFAPTVTCIRSYIFTKFEVSKALRFRVNRRHETDRRTDGRTDEVQHLMLPCKVGCIIIGTTPHASNRPRCRTGRRRWHFSVFLRRKRKSIGQREQYLISCRDEHAPRNQTCAQPLKFSIRSQSAFPLTHFVDTNAAVCALMGWLVQLKSGLRYRQWLVCYL